MDHVICSTVPPIFFSHFTFLGFGTHIKDSIRHRVPSRFCMHKKVIKAWAPANFILLHRATSMTRGHVLQASKVKMSATLIGH